MTYMKTSNVTDDFRNEGNFEVRRSRIIFFRIVVPMRDKPSCPTRTCIAVRDAVVSDISVWILEKHALQLQKHC